jgi:hypothetical protein
MADELEPPSLAEMRVAIDSVLPAQRAVPWGWIVGSVAALAVIAIGWALLGRSSTSLPASTAASSASPAVVLAPTSTIPPPPARSASAEPAAPPTSTEPPAAAADSAPAAPAATRPPPRKTPRPSGVDDVGDPFAAKH